MFDPVYRENGYRAFIPVVAEFPPSQVTLFFGAAPNSTTPLDDVDAKTAALTTEDGVEGYLGEWTPAELGGLYDVDGVRTRKVAFLIVASAGVLRANAPIEVRNERYMLL